MVLAAHGTYLEESTIEAEARMVPGGTPIEELERLARHFGLVAEIQQTTIDQLRAILAERKLAIVYLNRKVFELSSLERLGPAFTDPNLHTVVPTRVSDRFVTFHDPLPPRSTRRSIARFDRAQWFLQHAALVCSLREPGELPTTY
jgi:ABC-type bacteriocin/lantibiotic exporter with double-glycine peptidase domain